MKKQGHRGRAPIPYLGEEQIDRGNNDKLHIFIPLQCSARSKVM
jgi:hypothetical protein